MAITANDMAHAGMGIAPNPAADTDPGVLMGVLERAREEGLSSILPPGPIGSTDTSMSLTRGMISAADFLTHLLHSSSGVLF